MKTKRFFADQVKDVIMNNHPNMDFKIDERDIFVRLDAIVNQYAEQNYFDNWKFVGEGIDEHFITTWDEVTVVDPTDEQPSYFEFPSNYAALPNNRGIDEIFPLKYKKGGVQSSPVIVMDNITSRRYGQLQAGRMEGRLSGYPKGNKFIFRECGVKAKYGNMSVRLVIRDSTTIGVTDFYPIPSNFEQRVIMETAAWFIQKREAPTDKVRDKNDEA
jgi:hypothetical protein